MQPGTYDISADVLPETRLVVFIDGQRVEDSWILDASLDAELVTHLPGSYGSGMSARHGTITIGPRADVEDLPPSPLRRMGVWPPRKGMSVDMYEYTDAQQWKQATAVVTGIRAGVGDFACRIDWRDDKDGLDQPTQLGPIASTMPGTEESKSGVLVRDWRRTGIEPYGVATEIMEDAGYRILPSPSAGTGTVSFYSLFQGKVYPRVGYTKIPGDTPLLEWDDDSGFQYLRDWNTFTPGFSDRSPGDDLQVFLRATRGGPSAQVRFTVSSTRELRVILSGTSNSVIVQIVTDGTAQTIIQQGFESDSPLPMVGVDFGPDVLQLWTADGETRQRFYADAGVTGTTPLDWTQVRVLGAAALMVKYGTRLGWNSFNWPSLRQRSAGPWLVRTPSCTRTVEPSRAGDVLSDISEATLTPMWHDEHGVWNMVPLSVLVEQAPVETLTTRRDITAGDWTETDQGVASSVIARYDAAALTRSALVRVLVSDSAGGKTLGGGDDDEQFVGPGADEEWILPDMSPLPASQNATLTMRDGRFSMWGGIVVDREGDTADDTSYAWAMDDDGPTFLSIDIDQITPRQWKVTHSVTPGAPDVQLTIIPNGASIPILWRDKALPVWRARGRASFVPATEISRMGPSWAPAIEHDIGAWGDRSDARRVADFVGGLTDQVVITLDRLDVWNDPRRQLGDIVTVHAPHEMGGTLRCLTVGIHKDYTRDGIFQALDVVVLAQSSDTTRTYADVEDSHSTYAALEDAYGTYAQMEDG